MGQVDRVCSLPRGFVGLVGGSALGEAFDGDGDEVVGVAEVVDVGLGLGAGAADDDEALAQGEALGLHVVGDEAAGLFGGGSGLLDHAVAVVEEVEVSEQVGGGFVRAGVGARREVGVADDEDGGVVWVGGSGGVLPEGDDVSGQGQSVFGSAVWRVGGVHGIDGNDGVDAFDGVGLAE